MKMKIVMTVLLLGMGLMLGACQKAPEPTKEETKPAGEKTVTGKEINLFIYSEYIGQEMLDRFKQETGIAVRPSFYDTTEDMMSKMQTAGGASQYDVVVASDHIIPVMAHLKLLRPLEAAKVPNMKNVDPQFANPPYDPGSKYSAPYQWGTMGIIYRKDKVGELEPSWSVFFDAAKQPGPFVLIESMRDMMGAALLAGGKSMSTKTLEEIKKAGELILAANKSPKCLGFDGGVGGKNKVAAGQAALAIAYSGDAIKAMDEDKNIGYALPREGTEIWVDAMTVPAQAPNAEGAHAFINFILDAKNGAELSNYNRYATPNAAAMPMISEADRKNPAIYPGAEDMKRMQYLEDIGEATRYYDEVWTTVKSR